MVFFAAAVLLIRPIAFFVSLAGTRLNRQSRLLIAWFGPRGLSSLLLILVPVFASVPGAENLFSICCLVVLLSVALHGGSLMFLKRDGATVSAQPLKIAIVGDGITNESPATLSASEVANHEGAVVTIAEMRQIQRTGAPYLILDVRAEVSFANSDLRAQGSLRIAPDRAVSSLTELDVPRQTWLFAFCA
jgi:NhaP-type Na+/H+ and K+/H+ antiporter